MDNIIFSYTRSQAIEDGVLFDLSELAKDYGFKFPLAVTAGVHSILNNLEVPGQDFDGRAWDMLTILKLGISKAGNTDTIYFQPLFATKSNNHKIFLKPVDMWAKVSGGDNGEPVITVMLKGED